MSSNIKQHNTIFILGGILSTCYRKYLLLPGGANPCREEAEEEAAKAKVEKLLGSFGGKFAQKIADKVAKKLKETTGD